MEATRAADRDAEVDEAAEPKPNRQHERSRMSTARLLAAAAELFADQGYRQTSLAEIGKRAGYSHGLVTRRFGSKQGLLIALLDHVINSFIERELVPAVGSKTGIEGFRAFFAAFCANAKANTSIVKALESLMFEGLLGEPELTDRLILVQQHGLKRFIDFIEGGIADGTVRPTADAYAIALMASTAVRGITYRWLLEDDFDLCAAMNALGDVLEALLPPND